MEATPGNTSVLLKLVSTLSTHVTWKSQVADCLALIAIWNISRQLEMWLVRAENLFKCGRIAARVYPVLNYCSLQQFEWMREACSWGAIYFCRNFFPGIKTAFFPRQQSSDLRSGGNCKLMCSRKRKAIGVWRARNCERRNKGLNLAISSSGKIVSRSFLDARASRARRQLQSSTHSTQIINIIVESERNNVNVCTQLQ